MTLDELCKYWEPAARNLFKNCPQKWREDVGTGKGWWQYTLLDEALGVKTYLNEYYLWNTRRYGDHLPLPEELKPVLRALAGPHAHTILKMYRIQRGLEKEFQCQMMTT